MNAGGIKIEVVEPTAAIEPQRLSHPEEIANRPAEGLEGHLNRYGADISQCPMLRNIGESALAKIQAEVADITEAAEKFKGLSIDDLLADKKAPVEKETIETLDTILESKTKAAEHVVTQADNLIDTVHLQTADLQMALEQELARRLDVVEQFDLTTSESVEDTFESSDLHQSQATQNTDTPRNEYKHDPTGDQTELVITLPEQKPAPVTREMIIESESEQLSILSSEKEDYVNEKRITFSESLEPQAIWLEEVIEAPEDYEFSAEGAQLPVVDTPETTFKESYETQLANETEEPQTIESLLEVLYDAEVIDQLENTEQYQQLIEQVTTEIAQIVSELVELDTDTHSEELRDRCDQITQLLIERYDLPAVEAEVLVQFVQRMAQAQLQEEISHGVHQDLLNTLGTTEYRFYKAQSQTNPPDLITRTHRMSRTIMQLVMNRQKLAVA